MCFQGLKGLGFRVFHKVMKIWDLWAMFQGLESSCLVKNDGMWDFEKLVQRKRGRTENDFDGKKVLCMEKSGKILEKTKWEPVCCHQ